MAFLLLGQQSAVSLCQRLQEIWGVALTGQFHSACLHPEGFVLDVCTPGLVSDQRVPRNRDDANLARTREALDFLSLLEGLSQAGRGGAPPSLKTRGASLPTSVACALIAGPDQGSGCWPSSLDASLCMTARFPRSRPCNLPFVWRHHCFEWIKGTLIKKIFEFQRRCLCVPLASATARIDVTACI